jgi:hypothetical protein
MTVRDFMNRWFFATVLVVSFFGMWYANLTTLTELSLSPDFSSFVGSSSTEDNVAGSGVTCVILRVTNVISSPTGGFGGAGGVVSGGNLPPMGINGGGVYEGESPRGVEMTFVSTTLLSIGQYVVVCKDSSNAVTISVMSQEGDFITQTLWALAYVFPS